ncbi:MAG: outer membrane beta-barrel protein [Proteobacteria bacterium]|nr:outer membrane beta-barrel protein [Pseudomonadota bacterium]
MDKARTAILRALLCLMLVCGMGAAYADNGLFYVGAGVSKAKLDDITSPGGVHLHNLDNTSWKIYGGLRPIGLFAVEADYLDLGSQTSTFVGGSADARYKAFAAYGVGFLPIPLPWLDVFGKAGLARWNSSGGGGFPGGSFFSLSDHGTDFAWGVGAQAHIGNIGGRLEYEGFRIPNTNGARVFSLSAFLNLM